ncbi:hypothetical protein [Flavobacterium hungaricum]|uniref:Uncharacterized protein n=1 Tax=Flavobacterium hungaricum TaxID=2082725 RepID=A0ABR9TQA7_9FLAO|nr:hypothetical protein [Flavobacterium hungaricum]MBE8727510.1 hypothetical protein [Flavobacterium hungaricum]
MKKLFTLFLLFCNTLIFSQTVLNSFPLNLNFLGKTQILNTEDEKNNAVYVFAWDDENINILKYNKSLFLTNQFTDSIKKEKNRNLIGCSIDKEQKPTLYWSSLSYKNILISTYDLENKTSKSLNFDFPRNHEYVIYSFQQHNAFYILAKEIDFEHLLLYKFEDGKCEIKMFDLSTFTYKNKDNVSISFNALIKYFPIKKIEPDVLNPIDVAARISKLYVQDDHLILTVDSSLLKTQAFDLTMSTGKVKERTFNLPAAQNPFQSANSFYFDKKLFQVVANTEEFVFEIKDFESGNSIKTYRLTKSDSIPFKMSPFYMQVENKKPRELETTAKFLKNLEGLTPGISITKNNKNNFITFSGLGEFKDFYYNAAADDDFGERSYYSAGKMVYFDAMLNENFDFIKDKRAVPSAIDNLFYFLNSNKKIQLYDALKLEDSYLLSYYDTNSKQYIMRRFTEGYSNLDSGNPISNKSLFSQPVRFEKIKSR